MPQIAHIAGQAAKIRSGSIATSIAGLFTVVNKKYIITDMPAAIDDNVAIFFFVMLPMLQAMYKSVFNSIH